MDTATLSSIKLNIEQQAMIKDSSDLLIIYAGPGTGKTTTIIHKAIKTNSLILTFSKQAAISLKSRLDRMQDTLISAKTEAKSGDNGTNKKIQQVYTIHGFAYKILQDKGLDKNLLSYPLTNIIFEELFKGVKFSMGVKLQGKLKKQLFDLLPFIKAEKVLQKNFNLNLAELLNLSEMLSTVKAKRKLKVSTLLSNYTTPLKTYRAIDYMDILINFMELLQKDVSVLKSFKNFEYVMVDEFQDLNIVQYVLLQNLNRKLGTKLIVIGDPNQSIYGFRGATSGIFERIYNEASKFFNKEVFTVRVLTLDKNYRSSSKIISVANRIFSRPYKLQSAGNIDSNIQDLPFSGVKVITTYNRDSQATLIPKLINDIIGGVNNESTLSSSLNQEDKTIDFSDFVVITRTNFELIPIIHALDSFGITYQLLGDDSIFNDNTVLFLLEIMKVLRLSNAIELVDYSKINALRPKTMTVSDVKALIERLKDDYELLDINKAPAAEIVQNILDKMNLKYTRKIRQFLYFLNDPNIRNLSICELNDYISNLASTNFYDKKFAKVALGTMHATKGLEFKYVFIPNFVDKNIPFVSKRLANFIYDNMAEEKRLFYVAITRAKVGLILLYPKFDKDGNKQLISPYYEQIKAYVKNDIDPGFKRFNRKFELKKLEKDQLRMI